jgi:hypothetical protein
VAKLGFSPRSLPLFRQGVDRPIIKDAPQASCRAGSRQVKDVNVSFVGASATIVTSGWMVSIAHSRVGRLTPSIQRSRIAR